MLKRGFKLALFGLCITLPACSYVGDSAQKKKNPVVLKASNVDCFGQASQTVENYFNHKASLAAVNSLADCSVRALDEFNRKVVGARDASSYSLAEIDDFLANYLDRPGTFDGSFIELLFQLKDSLLGGGAKQVSKAEIAKLRSLVLDLKASAQEIDPYLDILISRKTIDPSNPAQLKKFEAALQALSRVEKRLRVYLQTQAQSSDEFSNEQLLTLTKKLGLYSKISKYENLLGSAKSILIGGTDTGFTAQEWPVALSALTNVYSTYLRYNNILKPLPLGHPSAAKAYHTVSESLVEILNSAINRQPQQVIALARLQKLVSDLEVDDLLPYSLTATSINKLLPTIFNKILVDRLQNIPPSGGFGLPEISMIKYDLDDWLYGHDVSLRALQPNGHVVFDASDLNPLSPMQKSVMQELTDLFMGRPFAYDQRGLVMLGRDGQLPPLTRDQIAALNIKRLALEVALRAYAADLTRAQNLTGLTEAETQQVYLDLKGVGKDVGFVDRRNPEAGTRTHMETNLFMSTSNGNAYLEMREGIEWFNIAQSSASQSDLIYKDISARCPLFSKDILGKPQIDVSCFRQQLHDNFASYFVNLPGMVDYVKTTLKDDKSWNEFMASLESAGRPVGASPLPMDSSAFRAMVTLLHYDESLLLRFDVDANEVLEKKEIDTAFPLLRGYISKLGSPAVNVPIVRGPCLPEAPPAPPKPGLADKEFVQKIVFDYLIRAGTPPPTSTWQRILYIPAIESEGLFVKESVSRLDIMKLVASFTVFGNQTQQKNIKYLYDTQAPTLLEDLKAGTCSIDRQIMKIFKCDYDSLPDLTAFLKTQSPILFARPQMTGAIFGQNLEQALQSDAVMKTECLPF